jgi:hypothetical protein
VSSWNTSDWIATLAEDYKRTVRSEESQIQSLSNDYIKFLRFGERNIEQTGVGILGLITGHGYLHGTQPHDLRNHLSDSFDRCYCLDLHGSVRRAGTHDTADEPSEAAAAGIPDAISMKTRSARPKCGGSAPTLALSWDFHGQMARHDSQLARGEV